MLLQRGLVSQLSVGDHPERTFGCQQTGGRGDELSAKFRVGFAGLVKRRVHDDEITVCRTLQSRDIGPMHHGPRVRDVQARALNRRMFGFVEVERSNVVVVGQGSLRQPSPACAQIGALAAQLAGYLTGQLYRSGVS